MSKLPNDLIVEILLRLPVKLLLQLKSVCKSWQSIISDPEFVKLHLKRAKQTTNLHCNRLFLSSSFPRSIDLESYSSHQSITNVAFPAILKGPPTFSVRILGSCNGVICLLDDYGKMFLWNPATRDYKELPNPNGAVYTIFLHGFGYNVSTDDYGILSVSDSVGNGTKETLIELYSLKRNTWRKIDAVVDSDSDSVTKRSGIFWNGALYWLKVKKIDLKEVYTIVSFDMVEEKFEDVISLDDEFDPKICRASLGQLGNRLCVFCEWRGRCLEGLVLINGRKEVFWSRLFSLKHERFPGNENSVLCLTGNGEVAVETDGWKLNFYNPKDATLKNLNGDSDSCESELYMESLVSPNSF
ncbi:F-box/kelch-repeat protein At3g06240-like [Euphorbia lathyris]|uniref:F-box/kelch-repeat protein At3g06240-like n=1 Tax=Euphorbia lathyris TaxID=212925 RepID=UPI003313EAE4